MCPVNAGVHSLTANNNEMTISYGSFSITLAGQDKPFDLLRQVTDYYCYVAKTNPDFGSFSAPETNLHLPQVDHSAPVVAPSLALARKQRAEQKRRSMDQDINANIWSDEDNSENLQNPAALANTLILEDPMLDSASGNSEQIHAVTNPLTHVKVEPLPLTENATKRASMMKSKYPFRHFPLRQPNKNPT